VKIYEPAGTAKTMRKNRSLRGKLESSVGVLLSVFTSTINLLQQLRYVAQACRYSIKSNRLLYVKLFIKDAWK